MDGDLADEHRLNHSPSQIDLIDNVNRNNLAMEERTKNGQRVEPTSMNQATG